MTTGKLYIEDVIVGERWRSEPITVNAEGIVDFGRKFDPQPFHTDPEAAKNSPFGGLIASGWQLASLAMKICVEARFYGGTPVIGLGVDELRWHMPVRPGDMLVVERQVVDVQFLPDKPRRGTVRSLIELRNQRGELVLHMYGLSSIPRRKPSDESKPVN